MKAILQSLALIFCFVCSLNVLAQTSLSVSSIRTDATFEHIGVNASINGDTNLNSKMDLYYKVAGAATYLHAGKSMRAHPGLVIDGSTWNYNFHAASAMMLVPDNDYELKMIFSDPDGGGTIIYRTVRTKAIPEPSMQSVKYVVPGSGGGTGTLADPFQGLQAAADNAQAGDHFVVKPGTYSKFAIENNGTAQAPISFKSEILHTVIIDGGGASGGIIVLGRFDNAPTKHIIIDGFTIQNGRYGIDGQHTQFVTVRNNIMTDVDYGFVNRRESSLEQDQYIFNNEFIGNTTWPQSGIPNERAIDVRGNNNVISFNTIKDFGDGISTDGPSYRVAYSIDIHNNEIKNIVDDHIEIDGLVSNGRVYQNRGFNGRAGVSLAPIFGGPAYVFRNVFFNIENSAFKMNRSPSGLVIVNNTVINEGNAISSPAGWQNTYFRNNVVFASRYCFEEYDLVSGSIDDWDYGAYKSTRSGDSGGPWFKWDNIRYNNVPALQASGVLEGNSIAVDFGDFVNVTLPTTYGISYDPSQRDFRPTNASAVINSGVNLNNLNRVFVTDGMVDRGALEYGSPSPVYGAVFGTNTCADGIKNGTEEYIDCGGNCPPCNDCPYATAIVSDLPIQTNLNLKTTDWIYTDGVIPSFGNVTMKAGNCVGVGKEFEVINGGIFAIDIEDCN